MADPSKNPNFGYMTEQMLEVCFVKIRNIFLYYDLDYSVYNQREIYQLLHPNHLVLLMSLMKKIFGIENQNQPVQAMEIGKKLLNIYF
jgi:hypothetical protein